MMKNSKIRTKTVLSCIAACVVLLFTSQCFAQSSTNKNQSKVSSFQYMKNFNQVFDYVLQNYVDELDPKSLYEGALKGMLDSIGDPYTLYLDPEYMRDLNDTTAGNFGGVGLQISKPTENKPDKPAYIEVSTPIEDTPGFRAGIQAGDYIIAIDGKPTPEMTMNEALGMLRGKIGETVTVTILRGKNMKFDVKLVRALIEVPTVKYEMLAGTKTGYVRLIQFTPETPKRVQQAISEFTEAGYDSLIIDLRDNPGGLLESAFEIGDMFIDEGPIVTTKSRLLFENQEFKASPAKTIVKDIPIVVLINRGSASASEILSGALKDNHLAYLVGERTYGKGSVQQVIPLSHIDGIKLTMARYYTPSDTNIDKIGIPPDYEIANFQKLSEEDEKIYISLIESKIIDETVEKNPGMKEQDIAGAAVKISKNYPLDLRILRRLIRIQVQRTGNNPINDMDYDLQLKEAMKIVKDPNFTQLIKNTKTLKQLQEEVEAANAADENK